MYVCVMSVIPLRSWKPIDSPIFIRGLFSTNNSLGQSPYRLWCNQ